MYLPSFTKVKPVRFIQNTYMSQAFHVRIFKRLKTEESRSFEEEKLFLRSPAFMLHLKDRRQGRQFYN